MSRLADLAAREPLWARFAAALVVTVAAHYGLRLGPDAQLALTLGVFALGTWLSRRAVSPVAKSIPPAAGPLPNKEQHPMNLQEAWAEVQAKAASMTGAVEAFLAAHPEIEAEAAATLRSASDDLAQTATAAVDASAPPDAHQVLDDAISAVDAKLESEIAALQANAQTQKDALQTAKSLLPAPVSQ